MSGKFWARKLDEWTSGFVGPVVVAMVAAVLVSAWEVLQSGWGPTAAVLFLFSIGSGLWITNQIRQGFTLRRRVPDDDELEDKIQHWLYDQNLTTGRMPSADVTFQIKVIDPESREIFITKYRGSDKINFATHFFPGPDQNRKLQALTPHERSEFVSLLVMELARFGVWFTPINPDVASVSLYDDIIAPSISEALLMDRIKFMRRAHALAAQVFIQAVEIRRGLMNSVVMDYTAAQQQTLPVPPTIPPASNTEASPQ